MASCAGRHCFHELHWSCNPRGDDDGDDGGAGVVVQVVVVVDEVVVIVVIVVGVVTTTTITTTVLCDEDYNTPKSHAVANDMEHYTQFVAFDED